MATLDDDDDFVPRRRTQLMGPAAQARALAEATAKLAARRQRDALPHRIETARLVLRAPIRGDVPDLVKLADNKAIAEKLSRLPHPYTRADGIGFVEIIAQRPDERPYAITLDDQFVGVVGFTFHEGQPPELGYWLGEPYWGRGIMSEAVKGLIEAAFATRLFPRLKARALVSNDGSRNVLTKAGFIHMGEGPGPTGTNMGKPVVFYELEQPKWS
ncbi:MAG: GNAT family N-acetyltransferase [Devosia sp.]|nr:GNAT family N-acetyltransferase [Devosia sp.]